MVIRKQLHHHNNYRDYGCGVYTEYGTTNMNRMPGGDSKESLGNNQSVQKLKDQNSLSGIRGGNVGGGFGNGTLSNGGSGQTRAGVQFGKNGEVSTESESFLSDEFYNKKLPNQVMPGIKYLPKYDEFGNVKQIKMYDDYGREAGLVDYTDHGDSDISSPHYHTILHWHERIYNAQNRYGMKINHRTDTNTPLGDKV